MDGMEVNVNKMTVKEFDLYLKKNKDKLFNFDKYRTEQRRNTGVIYTPTLKTAMQRRKSK